MLPLNYQTGKAIMVITETICIKNSLCISTIFYFVAMTLSLFLFYLLTSNFQIKSKYCAAKHNPVCNNFMPVPTTQTSHCVLQLWVKSNNNQLKSTYWQSSSSFFFFGIYVLTNRLKQKKRKLIVVFPNLAYIIYNLNLTAKILINLK